MGCDPGLRKKSLAELEVQVGGDRGDGDEDKSPNSGTSGEGGRAGADALGSYWWNCLVV